MENTKNGVPGLQHGHDDSGQRRYIRLPVPVDDAADGGLHLAPASTATTLRMKFLPRCVLSGLSSFTPATV